MKNKISLIATIIFFIMGGLKAQSKTDSNDINFPYKNMPEVFPGTKLLTYHGDISSKMLDGAHKFIEQKILESVSSRSKFLNRNLFERQFCRAKL